MFYPQESQVEHLLQKLLEIWLPRETQYRWSPLTESLLMWASRTEHVEKLIRPSLRGW